MEARKTMLNVFNRIWDTESGHMSAHWKRAIIVPVLKKNKDSGHLNSYRLISLTSILAKTMERLVVNRLNWYLEEYGILAVEQAGFRNNRSTCDHVTQFSQFVKDALDGRNILTAVYIDFKGAYDSV
ncbi:hypothetical protein AVEN_213259-1 [Araneus ventricosus]|uniref:Reverse transcriptase domain-containing protein n=1 Tax=Araneus ventricosus TaxID=182803 RepID=A0A4Y2DDM8_ARAVE|nr:hypothetical protein AVEN_213259-1 [Araneus ventricosus]